MNADVMVDVTMGEGREPSFGERFGNYLANERRARGWTQSDLAQRAGVSITLVQNLEQGKLRKPNRERVRTLVEAMGLRYADVLIGIGEIEPDDIGLEPADPAWRRLQALWVDLEPDQRETVLIVAGGMVDRKRARAD